MSAELRLREYQKQGVAFLLRRTRAILGDDPGLGKTAQVVQTLHEFIDAQQRHSWRALIVCPSTATLTWEEHLKRMWPECGAKIIRLEGNPQERADLLAVARAESKLILITTYELFRRLILGRIVKGIQQEPIDPYWQYFDAVICDEARRFRNKKSRAFEAIQKVVSIAAWPTDGTPASRGPQDLWTMLNWCYPKIFKSYWKFVYTWCNVVDNGFGKEISGIRNEKAFMEMISHYMIRRTKREVLPELPKKTRDYLTITMAERQKEVYDQLAEELMADLRGLEEEEDVDEIIITPNEMTKILRLRQLLCCPALIYPENVREKYKLKPIELYGAGIYGIADHMTDTGHHKVIFTPFTAAFPYFRQCLQAFGKSENQDWHINELQGGMKPEEIRTQIDEWKATNGIMLCSIQFAQSFELVHEGCDTAYFLGYEWDPNANSQAEDRLHRMITEWPITILYVRHKYTIDDHVMDIIGQKTDNSRLIMREASIMKQALERIQ